MSKLKQASATGPEISLAYLHDIADGSNEFMVEMIDIFLNQTPAYFENLEQAIASHDWATVAEISHKVRPTFTFVGVEGATEKLAEMERNARSGENLQQIVADFAFLNPLVQSVFVKLKTIRAELHGQA
jgi:HPt (histidine-containing phosphotransfer) domain-containing protein